MKRFMLAASLLALSVAPTAEAQFTTDLTSQGSMEIQSLGLPGWSPVGTYQMKLTGNPGQPVIDVWCVDFFSSVTTATPYNANFTSFAAGSPVFEDRTRFNDVILYKKAAFLVMNYLQPAVAAVNLQAATAAHCALWTIMQGAAPPACSAWVGIGSYEAALAAANAAALNDFNGMNFRYWFVVSDIKLEGPPLTDAGGFQELITYQTPEPASMVLVATGLLGLGAASYRRRKRV